MMIAPVAQQDTCPTWVGQGGPARLGSRSRRACPTWKSVKAGLPNLEVGQGGEQQFPK